MTLREKLRRCFDICKSFATFLTYCHIEDKASASAIPFTLWAAQLRILPALLTAHRLIILKARQLGLTWLCAAYALWVCMTKPMQLVVVISAKEDWAIEFIDRVKFILDRLPDWMRPDIDKYSTQYISIVHKRGSGGRPLIVSEIKSLATTQEGAQSKTPTLLIMDETARNRYAASIYASSKPGIDKAAGRIIVISNSHKTGVGWPWTRSIYQGAMIGENDFERIFMPWWDCPERPKDFKERQLSQGMTADDFSQNYPETEDEAISAMLGSYFGDALSGHLDNSRIKGVTGRILAIQGGQYDFVPEKNGPIEVWRWPYHLAAGWDGRTWLRRYAAGVDISEGLGNSFSVAYVMDRSTGEMVARMRSNRVDAHTWGDMVHALAEYYDHALVCPERNGAGQTTVKRLSDLGANLYVRVLPGKVGDPVQKILGWQQTEEGKHELSGDLREWLRSHPGGVYCPVLVSECSTWIKYEGSERIGPEPGKLGDCVIAAGLTVQASHFLGAPAEAIEHPHAAWLQRLQDGSNQEAAAWAA